MNSTTLCVQEAESPMSVKFCTKGWVKKTAARVRETAASLAASDPGVGRRVTTAAPGGRIAADPASSCRAAKSRAVERDIGRRLKNCRQGEREVNEKILHRTQSSFHSLLTLPIDSGHCLLEFKARSKQ